MGAVAHDPMSTTSTIVLHAHTSSANEPGILECISWFRHVFIHKKTPSAWLPPRENR